MGAPAATSWLKSSVAPWIGVGALVCSASFAPRLALAAPNVTVVPFANVSQPIDIVNAGDSRLFVATQNGTIQVLQSDGTSLGTFLDITNRVISGGEQGLLGVVFHPNYASNGYFYVNYTRDPNKMTSGEAGEGNTRISRFSRTGGASSNTANPASEFVILDIAQPYSNHNAGDLHFGPDGKLWIGMGDGGSGCDPQDRAQDPGQLLGKMLRIDVDAGSPYAIPGDNPYAGPGLPLDEIWSFGLRNPFRFSFDRSTGDLWIGDVGQNAWEEIDLRPASSSGGENYGWDCREGLHPSSVSGCTTMASCAGPFTDPIFEYDHSGGRCAVIGGYVYRGSQFASAIGGHYFFSDNCSGDLYSLSPDGGGGFDLNAYGTLLPAFGPSSFGQDVNGELFVADQANSTVYRIEAEVAGTPTPTATRTSTATPATPTPSRTPLNLSCPPTPRAGCRHPGSTKASVLIRNDPVDDSKDKLLWKWLKGDATPKTAFGDPLPPDYLLCAYTGTAPVLAIEAVIPGAASCSSCWKETRSGFKYGNSSAGIRTLILKSGDVPGKAKIVLKGKGNLLPALPAVPVNEPVVVQLTNTASECWEASFSAPSTKNENDLYKDKSD